MEYGRGPGCEAHHDRDVTWFATGIPHPLFNGVMTAHLTPDEADHRIEEMIAIFRSRRIPLEWTVGSSTIPQDLGCRLEAKGLTHLTVVPGMALDLRELRQDPPPEGFEVEVAEGPRNLGACLRVATSTFELPSAVVPRLLRIELGMPEDHRETTVAYVGRLRGRAVASSVLFLSAGVAGVYFVGTLAAARGRGIGRAMTAWALREGRERGFRYGTLQATDAGLPVYRRLGFRECSRFEIYT